MRSYRIASIPADGIGPEVISAGLEALDALASRDGGFKLEVDHYDWGSAYFRKHGVFMPAGSLETLKNADAIYFGAVGAEDIPDHISLWGLRLPICQGFDQYANIRPTRVLPGVVSPLRDVGPGDLDWLIVRENSEGEYAGVGGRAHQGKPIEVARATSAQRRCHAGQNAGRADVGVLVKALADRQAQAPQADMVGDVFGAHRAEINRIHRL